MFVLPSPVAVLTEGLPAAFLSVCPVGGSGCTHSEGLLFWHHECFLKSLTLLFGYAKYYKENSKTFHAFGLTAPCLEAGPEKTNMFEHPYSRGYWGMGSLIQGRLGLSF